MSDWKVGTYKNGSTSDRDNGLTNERLERLKDSNEFSIESSVMRICRNDMTVKSIERCYPQSQCRLRYYSHRTSRL
jgi:hypothetical protein